ncbi:hypothetical protein BGZ96_008433 [Linnemannia gamsii]|uniref:F-box domain-containing protein n=1 Tax=Linnemannia gamsii TaxID=64522 RepID=A0ABQ7KG29_9FUNG|nr:hypothetical protein BGZ96_008433 [Linnemannia gamsii]
MSTSCKKFFNIPELIDLVMAHLNRKDVLNFVLTNRRMHKLVTPLLYRKLEKYLHNSLRIFTSFPALHALARNVQHVRTLKISGDELAYLYNCVLAFEELILLALGTPLSRPVWLPPPDIRSSQVVALPPMVRLSVLELHLGPSKTYPYTVPSANFSQASLARLSWLISLNPGLTSLTLYGVPIHDLRTVGSSPEQLRGCRC